MNRREEEIFQEEEQAPPGVRIASIARWVLLAAALLGVGFTSSMAFGWLDGIGQSAAAYHCPMHPTVVSDHPSDCPICGMDLVPIADGGANVGAHAHHHHDHDELAATREAARALGAKPGQWICPMTECGVVREEPGRCEVCGMRLVQVPDDLDELPPGLAEVHVPPERLSRIGVGTTTVRHGRLQDEVRGTGTVAPEESARYVVQVRVSGWVESVLVDEPGIRVKAGQILARIASPELQQAQAEFVGALGWGEETAEAAASRLRLLGMAEQDIAALRRSKTVAKTVPLRAKKAGHVLRKEAVAGAYLEPGSPLFEIGNLDRIWVVTSVGETELGKIDVGSAAVFEPASGRGPLEGEVARIYPSLDAATRTAQVRLLLPNPDLALLPGMHGVVRIDGEGKEGTLVSRDAVIEAGEHAYVILAKGGGLFAPKEVRILGRDSENLLVEGVSEGDEVVSSAGFFIDAESRLRAALQGMGAISGGAHSHGADHD